MVLFLHNRYRTTGGEERVVDELMLLVREQLGEQVELLDRDSATMGRGRAAAGLLRGGLRPEDVGRAVRTGGARVVHAHNLNPTLGWRALAAARAAGARVVLHLHQYRIVCAIGVCFTRGAECTRCHGRNTLPGVRLNCRSSIPEAAAYGASLALWQRRLAAQADAVIVPSAFARERLRELGAPLSWERVHVLPPPVREPSHSSPVKSGSYALVVSRLARGEGGRCGNRGLPGRGGGVGDRRRRARARGSTRTSRRLRGALRRSCGRFASWQRCVPGRRLRSCPRARLRPSAWPRPRRWQRACRWSRAGWARSRELLAEQSLVPADDVSALALAIGRLAGDRAAGARGLEQVRALCAPERVAASLASIYDAAR